MSINTPEDDITNQDEIHIEKPHQPAKPTNKIRAGVRTAAQRASDIREQNNIKKAGLGGPGPQRHRTQKPNGDIMVTRIG